MKPSNPLTENRAFLVMAQLARDADNDAGRLIRSLVTKTDAERALLLATIIAQFQAGGAPSELVSALEFLRHPEVAQKLRSLLP